MLCNQESQWLADSRRKTQPAGSWLLRRGKPQSRIHLLYHDMARVVYHAGDGVEGVKEFYSTGEYCFLYLNWLINTPAGYDLRMISAGGATKFPLALLGAPESQDIKTQLLVQQLIYKEKEEQMLLFNASGQRYQYVQAHFPDWESQFIRRDLASCIGITPVSLSHIRQCLNKGQCLTVMRRLLPRHSLIDGDHNEYISSFSDTGWHQLLTKYFRFSFSTPGYHFNAAHQPHFSASYPPLSFGLTRCGWVNDHYRMLLRSSHRHLLLPGDVGTCIGVAAV